MLMNCCDELIIISNGRTAFIANNLASNMG